MAERIIPRKREEFEEFLKPLYDEGDYRTLMDRIERYRKRKKNSSTAIHEYLQVALPVVFKSELPMSSALLLSHFNIGYDDLSHTKRWDFEPFFNKFFTRSHKSVANFLHRYYKAMEWDGYLSYNVRYHTSQTYLRMIKREMKYDRSIKFALENDRIDILVSGLIEFQLTEVYKKSIEDFRISLGLEPIPAKWKNEYYLFERLKLEFPNHIVIFQGSPHWLGQQRFDVWLPEFNLAIEYNGLQHYEAVEFFGGEEGLRRTRERDEKKRRLAKMNNTRVIELREGYSWNSLLNELDKIIRS